MPEWVEKVITASPAAIFAVMWWLERTERVAIMERALAAMIETKSTLQTLASILKSNGRPSS
jgi:uncharacterized membrane protein YfbV (UPF0208 family)